MLAMDNACREMYGIVLDLRITRAFSSKTTPDAMRVFHPGELVRIYRERPDMWTGPFPVTRVDGKTVYVRDGIDEKPFYITSVKPHHTPRELSTLFMSTTQAVLHSLLQASPLSSPSISRTN
jgi:hypothetical protein